ncbi:peptidase S8/S53 domain-containing protein [Mycena vulgaris]|nr:peptidase S8/S53 domain-containing protein [Mycena vulgaris]
MRTSIKTVLVSAALLLPSVLAVVHESHTHLPHGWPNLASIDALLNEVAHPDSPSYGKHWTAQQVAEKFAPPVESVDAVLWWLIDSGIPTERIRVSGSQVNSTVAEAEKLLKAEYDRHIDLITPTVHFNTAIGKHAVFKPLSVERRGTDNAAVPQKLAVAYDTTTQQFTDLSRCSTLMTPVCLRALYGLNNVTLKSTASNSYGIVEYMPQAFVGSDLDTFAATWATDLVGKHPMLVSIDGGVLQTTTTGFDANVRHGTRQPVTLYQVGDVPMGASFNDFLDALDGSYCTFDGGDDPDQDGQYPDPKTSGYTGAKACGTAPKTNVISTSYGYNEADLTPFYTARQCNEYAKLGFMGVTVLYSSGDNGVVNTERCAGSPAGALIAGRTVLSPESACQDVIQAGGGFSNRFPTPGFQQTQVSNHLTAHPPPYGNPIYNASGRGLPDLSANGVNYVITIQSQNYRVFGTSASSPVVDAILTLINDARIAAGKAPIGYINPTIYSAQFASAFNDVTNGTNPGCGTTGFQAAEGWDPGTGLGTPNFPKLVKLWSACLELCYTLSLLLGSMISVRWGIVYFWG